MNEPLLTIDEVAAVLKVSRSAVYDLIKGDPPLPVVRLSDRVARFKMDDIVLWLEDVKLKNRADGLLGEDGEEPEEE